MSRSAASASEDGEEGGGSRRHAGSSINPKVVAGVFVCVAALIGGGMALNHLPDLNQLAQSTIQSQPASASPALPPESSSPGTPTTPGTEPGNSVPPVVSVPQPPPAVIPEPGVATTFPKPPVQAEPKKPPKRSRPPKFDRSHAEEEFDTDRGHGLLAEIKKVVIVRQTPDAQPRDRGPQEDDDDPPAVGMGKPSGPLPANPVGHAQPGKKGKQKDLRTLIWDRVAARSKSTIEKMGIEHSVGSGGGDVPVMIVTVEIQKSKKGVAGTQEIHISAELTCPDEEAGSQSSHFAKVWKAEQNLGTISQKSVTTGKIPNSVDENLAEFFGKFRAAYNRAVRATKESKDAAFLDRPRANSGV